MKRTDAEIEARLKKQYKEDGTGFEWTMYVDYLPYDIAKQYVPKLPHLEWEAGHKHVMSTPIIDQMRKYLPFAQKQLASDSPVPGMRSLRHYVAWFWLAGATEMSETIEKYLVSGQFAESKNHGGDMLEFVERAIKQEEANQ
jgi:hypothetical protein